MGQNLVRDLGWRTARTDLPYDLPNRLNSDSRRIEAGQWFLPIQGEHFDGHDFIRSALERGAAGFLYASAKSSLLTPEQVRLGIEVDDTTLALQDLARWWRCHTNCRIVGITGSSGKTTVKEMAAEMLSTLGPTLKTEGSLNNELGVPLTLCRLTRSHRFAVVEMGARHMGNIAFLSNIVGQNVGVLLNVGTAHVGEFGSIQKILETKMEISVAPALVYLSDDPRLDHAAGILKDKTLTSFGRQAEALVQLVTTKLDGKDGVTLQFVVKGQTYTLNGNFYHSSFPINAAACLAIGVALGLNPTDCIAGLQRFQGIKGRFKLHRIANKLLIDDCYNANPESMTAGLETLREAYSDHRTTLILGDMLELGDSSEAAHRSIGFLCTSRIKPEHLITVGPQAQWIGEEAIRAGLPRSQLQHFTSVEEIMPQLPSIWQRAELLYVKASNDLRLNRIVDMILTQ